MPGANITFRFSITDICCSFALYNVYAILNRSLGSAYALYLLRYVVCTGVQKQVKKKTGIQRGAVFEKSESLVMGLS